MCEYCKKHPATTTAKLELSSGTYNLHVCARCARQITKVAKEAEADARDAEYRAERRAELDAGIG